MNSDNPIKFDYNLIKVFCTIFETESLTTTAERLEITQPAISHQLKRLREYYNDPLFTRVEGKMLPTDLAARIAPHLKMAIERINHGISISSNFDPIHSDKRFIASMSDISELYFIPPLASLLETIAPNVKLEVIQYPQDQLEKKLRSGDVNFSLGHLPLLSSSNNVSKVDVTPLFTDRFVCMVREDHPLFHNNGIEFSLNHLKLVAVNSHITGHSKLIEKLTLRSDKVQISIPHYTVAPDIIRKSDYGVIIPLSLAKRFNTEDDFLIYDLPEEENNFIDVNIYTHRLFSDDQSIQWIVNIIRSNFSDL